MDDRPQSSATYSIYTVHGRSRPYGILISFADSAEHHAITAPFCADIVQLRLFVDSLNKQGISYGDFLKTYFDPSIFS